ncbi:hypothetical protein FB45DRAFT_864963 [Roridomyces roridus]|uniref:Uncharacterized protein n=1 Tax=Roridomyces roridus TaxID=1738132 RepID=A0AAD7FTW0_9AGAR|nr:hypothetical protein FB45DRAFT_864963 [Roridomyces roridus]
MGDLSMDYTEDQTELSTIYDANHMQHILWGPTFINRNCNPKVPLYGKWGTQAMIVITFGEELFVHYGDEFWAGGLTCNCNAPPAAAVPRETRIHIPRERTAQGCETARIKQKEKNRLPGSRSRDNPEQLTNVLDVVSWDSILDLIHGCSYNKCKMCRLPSFIFNVYIQDPGKFMHPSVEVFVPGLGRVSRDIISKEVHQRVVNGIAHQSDTRKPGHSQILVLLPRLPSPCTFGCIGHMGRTQSNKDPTTRGGSTAMHGPRLCQQCTDADKSLLCLLPPKPQFLYGSSQSSRVYGENEILLLTLLKGPEQTAVPFFGRDAHVARGVPNLNGEPLPTVRMTVACARGVKIFLVQFNVGIRGLEDGPLNEAD